jgi:hypothetical protein
MVRRLSSSWIAGVVAVGLGLAPHSPVVAHTGGTHRAGVVARTDLDAFSDARLDRDLQDELDDVFDEHSPDAVADVATIQAAIMAALQDEGDEGAEAEISLADLEAEMREAGTDVEDVVHDAIERLDHASLDRPTVHLAVFRRASGPGAKPSYGLAVRDAKRSLIREIRKSR